jgi:hypothetical protein
MNKHWLIVIIGMTAIITVIEANANDVWYNGQSMTYEEYNRESAQDYQIQQIEQQQRYDRYQDNYGSSNVYEDKGFAPSRLYDIPVPELMR